MSAPATAAEPVTLVRGLGTWDGALITIGGILGSAIFLAAADVGRAVPHAGLILLVWTVGGLLTLAGALTYAEMGTLFPEAGGQYHFIKEAYGPLWGFLFGWASFLVIQSGGIASLSAGFGEYLGGFLPFFSTQHQLFAVSIDRWTWAVNGGQVAAGLAIAFLTWVNVMGLKEGAGLQNAVTVLKVGSILGLAGLGLMAPPVVHPRLMAPLPPGPLAPALGVAMIAVLWSYDGWYNLTFAAGEMKDPGRSLPRGLLIGTAVTAALYVAVNAVYLRALPVETFKDAPRLGEVAAAALFGAWTGRLMALAVLISIFGCLSTTILTAARVYLPMAQDGLFFPAVARIHPVHRTPAASLVAQGIWATVLAFSGTYEQLYTYVVFAAFLFHAATGVALFVFRRQRPQAPRPYRTWGYPVVPAIFILTALAFVANTLAEKPKESLIGLGLVFLGLPAYVGWRRQARRAGANPPP